MAGEGPNSAITGYLVEQADRLVLDSVASQLLIECAHEFDQEVERVEQRLQQVQRAFCLEALESLGYAAKDLTALCDVPGVARWLCWCAKQGECEEVWEERLQEEMRDWREEVSDEENLREAILAKHAACIKVPKEFWRYWLDDDSYIYDDLEDWPTADKEWNLLQHVYIELAERNKQQRLARELPAARQKKLRPFYDKLKRTEPAASLIAFNQFCTELPSVKRLWWPPEAQLDQETWSALQTDIVRELTDKVRHDKICLFKRILRTLYDDGEADLPTWVAPFVEDDAALVQPPAAGFDSPSAIECDLTDADMDPIFRRVSALFRCGFCSDKLIYPDIARHLVEVHQASSITAYTLVPNLEFRLAVEDLLIQLKYPASTPVEAMQGLSFNVTERIGPVLDYTYHEQSWDQVLSGRRYSNGWDPDDSGLTGAESDRDIVEIWPCGP
ncbi:hypothetical protein JCM10908_005123 [Rhodotorula pacifica]|uniref:uncharacterized protein n=1 Tax=Rhodotorula pacifica TaxID=1495444 RepID=UPI00317C0218